MDAEVVTQKNFILYHVHVPTKKERKKIMSENFRLKCTIKQSFY